MSVDRSVADEVDLALLIEAVDVQSESAWPVHCALRNLKIRPVAVLPNGERRFVIALNCADDAARLAAAQRNDCKFQRATSDAAHVVKAQRQLQSAAEKPQRSKLNVPATKRIIGVALKNDQLIAQANRELRAERGGKPDRQQAEPAAPAPQTAPQTASQEEKKSSYNNNCNKQKR